MAGRRNIKIYSFYYKDNVIPVNDELYQPLMAGNVEVENNLKIPGDDTGDSISEKNYYFSELTGIYWVWKNTSQEVTGSCHYRRYFTAKKEPLDLKLKRNLYYLAGLCKKRHGLIYTNNVSRFRNQILTGNEITEILQDYDAILPQKRRLKYTVKKHYSRYHNPEDLQLLEKIFREKHPDFLAAFEKVMNSKSLYANNMFILPEEHYQQFMKWWFAVIFEFEKQIQPEDYKGYQQRIIGFIAERLLTIWFYHQPLKVKELPVIYFKNLKSTNK